MILPQSSARSIGAVAGCGDPHIFTWRDCYEQQRGGGWFTVAFSQRLGAVMAAVGARLGWRPRRLTAMALALQVVGSCAALTTTFDGWALTAVLAWTLWQLGYAMDCADGQLARVTGQATAAGARLDVLCDIAGQFVLAIVVGAVWVADGVDPLVVLAFSATRSVATTLSAVSTSSPRENDRGLVQHALRLPFDFPVQVTIIAGALALASTTVATATAIALTGVALLQLCRQIVFAATP